METYESVTFHRILINDRERSRAYRKAIFESVHEGDIVLDIGTGSGLLALFACQAGAKRVYAVERTAIIRVAERLARENGYGDRITFIDEDVRRMDLPEQVDVIVSELISKAVIGQHMEELTAICRDRFLKPGGRLVPRSVELFVAPVELPEQHAELDFPPFDEYQLDFSPARQLARNHTHSLGARIKKLAGGQVAYRVDTAKVCAGDNPDARLGFTVATAGILHGYCVWFSATLSENVVLTTQPPGLPAWDNIVFHLQEPVPVEPSMRIELALRATQPTAANPIWHWNTTIKETHGNSDPAPVLAQFQQSTFHGTVLTRDEMVRRSSQYRPRLTKQGDVLAALFSRLDGSASIAELAVKLHAQFPDRWRTREDAEIELQALLVGFHGSGYLAI
jgi:precorrin-6B methylase 2